MGRPYPHGRRRRPGRRPPNRYPGRPVQPGGFTAGPFGLLYRLLLPGLRGREKRAYFNEISRGMIFGFGFGGALIGYSGLGLLGAVLGFGVGIAAGGSIARKGRFYRP